MRLNGWTAAFALPAVLVLVRHRRAEAVRRLRDHAAQTRLRTVISAQNVHYAATRSWTDDPDILRDIEPNFRYERGDTPERPGTVYLHLSGERAFLSNRSESGTCFYVASPDEGYGYARDPLCRSAEVQEYKRCWDPTLTRWQRYRMHRRLEKMWRPSPKLREMVEEFLPRRPPPA